MKSYCENINLYYEDLDTYDGVDSFEFLIIRLKNVNDSLKSITVKT